MQRDFLRKPLHIVALVALILTASTAWLSLHAWTGLADINSCKSVYMYPSYARIKSFDESHTKFASKYSLYIYREQGLDPVPEDEKKGFEILDGIPVLFIPGNAGSFRQVRSIAAESANLFYDDEIDVVKNPNVKNLDFFAADFNEDFTAFHGRTLLDQAEYLNEAIRFILSLYAHNENPPKSVLILAHSMGGIVARVLPTLDNYVPESINTIVSLASPHSVPPLTFDGDILSIYSSIDRYWYRAFNDEKFAHYGALDDIALVSITGGLTDTVLPADYTTLGYLIPPSNGFTVFTTGISGVWTPMDHLAIVWCRQLRRSVSKALLEIVDFTSPSRTYSLEKRMTTLKQIFLTGFEEYYPQDMVKHSRQNVTSFKLDAQDLSILSGPHATWKSTTYTGKQALLSLIPLTNKSSISMISGGRKIGKAKQIGVYLCKSEGTAENEVVITNAKTSKFIELFCVDILPELHPIPRSAKGTGKLEESAFDGDFVPNQALSYNSRQIQGYETILVVDNRIKFPKSEFVVVSASDEEEIEITINSSLWTIISRGVETSFSHDRGLTLNLHFSGVWSSILSYKIHLKEDSSDTFEPFIRQWSTEPYETKWLTDIRSEKVFPISMHGIAPFTPFNTAKNTPGLNLQFWADPKKGFSEKTVTSLELKLSIDWINTLKLLVIRYRLAVVSHCLATTLLVMVFQLKKYATSGKFPDYNYGLSKITELGNFTLIVLFTFLLTPVTRLHYVQKLLNLLDPVNLRIPLNHEAIDNSDFKTNSLYLGIEEVSLSFFGCLFVIMAIGINCLISVFLTSVGKILVWIATKFCSKILSIMSKYRSSTQKESKQDTGFSKMKLVASAALLLMIPFYLPYQFVYIVCFIIQIFSCLKILWKNSSRSWWNYNFSILMIMLWVLPINVPILIVFIHNFNLNWATPFSSHHNFLAVAPILALIELHNVYGDVIPLGFKTKDNQPRLYIFKITVIILLYTIIYSMIYGIRHAFWLHHLFNFWCAWLVIISICQNFGSEV